MILLLPNYLKGCLMWFTQTLQVAWQRQSESKKTA
jgi:hypothetical protein